MNLVNSLIHKFSDAAMNDSETLATAVLTGLMTLLALIVFV